MQKKIDYLIVGSGIAGLSFGALMAKAGKKVGIVEAHEFPGGFGHTFEMARKYKFNAQLHYVWNCGEGETVHQVLKKLDLDETVTFERYDPDGFDHMYMPGHHLKIPSDAAELIKRLSEQFPAAHKNIAAFIKEVQRVGEGLGSFSYPIKPLELLQNIGRTVTTFRYLKYTLQDAFDRFKLPIEVQTLLALQWPDFLLPPDQLSFYAWVMLFTGYQRGAYYPTKHFEHVIDSLVQVVLDHNGEIFYNHEVSKFLEKDKQVYGVMGKNLLTEETFEMFGNQIICNMDPQKAAKMIGWEKFSKKIQKKLSYDYSPSNYMAYVVVKDLDLKKYGFGKWNTFHSGHKDLNEAFYQMYNDNDFSNPSFAMTTPSLLTDHRGDCPAGWQIIEFLAVANYGYFRALKDRDEKAYKKRKMEILYSIIDQVEKHYIPDFRKYMVFKMTGSPTTNERYCWCPEGNSYGSNMSPKNIGIGRLTHESSLKNFYFCNASAGYAGFSGTFWTGAALYQRLSGDTIF